MKGAAMKNLNKSFIAALLLFVIGQGTTAQGDNSKAFSQPSTQVIESRKIDFLIGRSIFKKLWVSSPSSTQSSDGLGPLYNARSCLSCHPNNGRGKPPINGVPSVSFFLQLSVPPRSAKEKVLLSTGRLDHIADPIYGSQLQGHAVQGLEGEAVVITTYQHDLVTLAGGEVVTLHKPHYQITNWQYGKPAMGLRFSPRIAPQMIGLGLLSAIPEEAVKANADPDDLNKDGVSGKASQVWSYKKQSLVLGRFGWKASTASVYEQSALALHSDMGLSNPLFRTGYGDCTEQQKACRTAPDGRSGYGDGLEVGSKLMQNLAFYAANLAVPSPRNQGIVKVQQGAAIFAAIGCASCHQPAFSIKGTRQESKSSGKNDIIIHPYSDLLLHDMGQGLADGRPVHNATGREWRTAPLWGVGLSREVNSNSYFLHDGRARSLLEAILWHGGEAKYARDRFAKLEKLEREKLLAFVASL